MSLPRHGKILIDEQQFTFIKIENKVNSLRKD